MQVWIFKLIRIFFFTRHTHFFYFVLKVSCLLTKILNDYFLKIRWIFKRVGCVCSAFTMYFVGCASVYLLVAISIERYLIFKSSMNKPHISSKYSVIILMICTILGLLWPIFPLFGWSYYSLETSYMVIIIVLKKVLIWLSLHNFNSDM